ncbi:MAG: type II secretion system protein [Cyanobacteria bacterium J06621_3]
MRTFTRFSGAGFTLIEMLIVLSVMGIIAGLAAPGWGRFLERSRLNTTSQDIYASIRAAQTQAQAKREIWQFSIRDTSALVEYAIHPRATPISSVSNWETVSAASIQIDPETTLAQSSGIYYVQFNQRGEVHYRLGRITLSSEKASDIKRCVVVSTLIGSMRTSQEQERPDEGKFCY